jgi:hypothetical protein
MVLRRRWSDIADGRLAWAAGDPGKARDRLGRQSLPLFIESVLIFVSPARPRCIPMSLNALQDWGSARRPNMDTVKKQPGKQDNFSFREEAHYR